MAQPPRRPLYHDYQAPRLFRAGVTLRRSFATGPAETPEEQALHDVLKRVDEPTR